MLLVAVGLHQVLEPGAAVTVAEQRQAPRGRTSSRTRDRFSATSSRAASHDTSSKACSPRFLVRISGFRSRSGSYSRPMPPVPRGQSRPRERG